MINGKERIFVSEDTFYEYSGESMYYGVKADGNLVYVGLAEEFPDGRHARIYVNRIARELLENGTFVPTETGLTSDSGASAVFSLVKLVLEDTELVEDAVLGSVTVIYGFEPVEGGSELLLNEPVNSRADLRMSLPLTIFSNSGATINI